MSNDIPVETLENTKAALELTHADWITEMKRANALEAKVARYEAALRDLRYQFSHGMYLSPQRLVEAEKFVDDALRHNAPSSA